MTCLIVNNNSMKDFYDTYQDNIDQISISEDKDHWDLVINTKTDID